MAKDLKEEIKTYYGGIAKKVTETSKTSCGCGSSCCGDKTNDNGLYPPELLKGLPAEAVTASLGCADPVTLADLKKGETVLDLGSGGGIDVLISAKLVGVTGKAYGLDMTDEMLELANRNKAKSGMTNVEFIKGCIEEIPLGDETMDVVMSNCVINLSESKEKVIGEIYRVLKKGGRLAVSDIVELKEIPAEARKNVLLWVGCVAGAVNVREYELMLKKAGFKDIEIKPVNIYTKDIIGGIADANEAANIFEQLDADLLDGAFAGANIKAVK
jgi:arsenite methyltransferase